MGRRHPNSPETNLHHIWSESGRYKSSGLEHAFRNYKGFVIPTLVAVHDYRHKMLGHPPKPTRVMMGECLDYVSPFDAHRGRFHNLDQAMRYFDQTAQQSISTERAELAREIHENLDMQRYYLAMDIGQVGTFGALKAVV